MKSLCVLASAFAVSCAIPAFADEAATDYRSWILDKGGTPVIAGGTSGTTYNKDYPPSKAFDGDVSTDSENRYLGSLSAGAYLVYGADIAGDETFTMTHYRICQPRANLYGNARTPTAWTLCGGDSSEGPWTEIESRSGVVWAASGTGSSSTIPALDQCWCAFTLATPQTYKFYKIAFSDSRSTDCSKWNVGVSEVEFISAPSQTETIVPPHAESQVLSNDVAFAEKVFDESAYPVDEQHALSYTGFDAADDASTTFLGGWWDFGAGAFLPTDASRRLVTLDGGAVVTNVGAVTLAGATGLYNKLRLKSKSKMSAASMTFGSKDDAQCNECEVSGGSSLAVSGDCWLNNAPSTGGNSRSKNVCTVSGKGSSLTVGAMTCLGNVTKYPSASTGGNTLYVTNGAVASLGILRIGCGCAFGGGNKVVIADDARVLMSEFHVNDSWSSSTGRKGTNSVLIASGSVVTNTGYFAIGYGDTHNSVDDYNELVISNAEFYTEGRGTEMNGVSYMIDGRRTTLRISGKDAKFIAKGRTASFSLFRGAGSSLIVENGATYKLPSGDFNYTVATSDETIHVRTGAKVTSSNGISTRGGTTRNKVVVESDGTLELTAGIFELYGTSAQLVVNNGKLSVPNEMWIGHSSGTIGTNALATVAGSHPLVNAQYNMQVQRNSCLRIELPAEGYDAGYATTEKPVIDVGSASSEKALRVEDGSRLEIVGAAAMQANCQVKREYVLIRANTGKIVLPSGQLAELQASMPDRVELFIRSKNGRDELVLQVKPNRRGMTVLLK